MIPTRRKYGNVPVEREGQAFDSMWEAEVWVELRLRERAGQLGELRRQVPYVLQEGFRDNAGTWQRAIIYIADFAYVAHGIAHVVDAKGHATSTFLLKAKLFRRRYPEIIFEVRKQTKRTRR